MAALTRLSRGFCWQEKRRGEADGQRGMGRSITSKDPLAVISSFYSPESVAFEILVSHGQAVAAKARQIADRMSRLEPDPEFIYEAAMLHDIGMLFTDAPRIGCNGSYPYICHGYLGRQLLESKGMPKHARVCECHVGIGITRGEIETLGLPLPARDMVPVTIEEQIICYADKFFSKNGRAATREKTVAEVQGNLVHYGSRQVETFQKWVVKFGDESGL